MANVLVIQRHAHLAAAVKLEFVNGREGKLAKAVLIAISNQHRGSGEDREERAVSIRWTLWGKQAEHAAEYLSKGSHVNLVGHLHNNHYQDGEGREVFGMEFTVEDIDYLDSRAEGEARRARDEASELPAAVPGAPTPSRKARSERQPAHV
ncbi:MAG: single-stranded DNA-binding protein [Hydrogenophaga sp.]|jgi:single-stranded DNA-binding protein|uniref:single-stranded DNA-binding protein n=1 Tax=Hydrogenophaga sp. TaxID=1904254 RepID=UPI00271C937B|nr:single-stranded DNA-binding protein [Hydrogenophaga sp.]MDO9032839.1 single-stranded DNA-binding protein [Hydrogenophaga sp.]